MVRLASIVLPMILLAPFALAQEQNVSARVLLGTEDIVVQPDGTATSTIHQEIQVLSAAVASQLAQQSIDYDGTLENIDVVEAYTLKPDGKKIAVDASTVISQEANAPTNALAAIYSDKKQKVIIFPNVEAGDTLAYTIKRQRTQPILNAQYFLSYLYRSTVAVNDSRVTVTVPKTIVLGIDAYGIDVKRTESGDQAIYSWSYSHPTPDPNETSLVADTEQRPHVFLSSLKTYDNLAHAYAALVKIAATPKIQAQADQITSGIIDKRAQAQAIYEWVAQRVRYIAVEFGAGVIVPHDPDWVLTNLYGDCKDHAILFASLLKAKGIEAELVLINAGASYSLSKVPEISSFNHMIVMLPEFKLYADTTSAFNTFGTLPLGEYGKPVLHVVTAGPALHQVPVVAKDLSATYKVNAVMDDQGRLEVHSTTIANGPMAADLRRTASAIQAIGPDKFASDLLQKHGLPRAIGTFAISPTTLSPQYELNGNFKSGAVANQFFWPVVDSLRVLSSPGDLLMGPLQNTKISDTDPTPCYSGHQIDDVSLQLLPGKEFIAIPTDVSIKTANLQYTTHWSRQGQTISLHREFVATVDQALCAGQLRKDTAAALASIRANYEVPLTLAAGSSALAKVSFATDDKLVAPAGPDSVGVTPTVQSALATSPNASHIDSIALSPATRNGAPSVIQQFVFRAPNGNAVTMHFDIISISAPAPQFSASDIRITIPQDQQRVGAMVLANSGCGAFPTPYSVVKRATLIDSDGGPQQFN